MKTTWWCLAMIPLAVNACSEADGSSILNDGGDDGGVPVPVPVEQGAARARRGEVTLLAASPSLPASSWSLVGPASDPSEGEAIVRCFATPRGAGLVVDIEATAADAEAPSADLGVGLPSLGPVTRDVEYDELSTAPDLAFGVRLPGGLAYGYGADTSPTPAVRSSCNVAITRLDDREVAGQVACRNLLAAARSTDAGSMTRASVTTAFDCPIITRSGSEPQPSGGSGGSAGTGGADTMGGSGSGAGGSAASGGSGGALEPVKSCQGSVSGCSSRTSATCSSVKGCSTDGECGGVSSSCYSRYSSYSCTSQRGCYWSSLDKSCSGSAWSCDLMSGSSTCVSQSGCDWDLTCEGVATPCTLLSELECGSQPGCSWR